MAGLVPAIHALAQGEEDVDARHKVGHDDGVWMVASNYTFSNGTLIALFFSSHSGTGRFLLRMKAGLNSLD